MKIDIISGFLGAGKTTFIKRLLNTNLKNEKVVLIENEFGEVSVDTDFLTDTGINIKELSQGCICCSLFGDFSKSLNDVVAKFNPDRILIEPSGVGKLSDIINAVKEANLEKSLNSLVCLVDANKAKMYAKNFGEFFLDQLETAHTIVLSRTDIAKEAKVAEALQIVRDHNPNCVLVTTPINDLSDAELFKAYEGINDDFIKDLLEDLEHHEHHHDHDEECCCEGHHEHHHDHDEECCCEGHHEHHHDHDEECCCEGHHEHHHDHDEECCCEEHHEHHHHADEVFDSIGIETVKKYNIANLKDILNKMSLGEFGLIVRAKGVICGEDNKWYQFNLTPEEVEVKEGNACPVGKICVIGSKFDEKLIKDLF